MVCLQALPHSRWLRLGWGSGLAYNYFIRGVEGHPAIKAGGGALYLISVMWAFMIWKVFLKRYFFARAKTAEPAKKASVLEEKLD